MSKMQNKSKTIIRTSKRENPYVMIDKYFFNDERLSMKARGLLGTLLCRPDDWQVYESELVKHSADGRDSIRAGLRELEKFGYLSRRQIRGENGSFGHMEYIVYERPITLDITEEITADGKSVYGDNQPQTENPSTGFPSTGNPPLLNNDLTKNDLTKDCLTDARDEIAAASESHDSIQTEIYETIKEQIAKKCYIANGVTMGESFADSIYLMLTRDFPTQLDKEVIAIACDLYADNTSDLLGTIHCEINKPVGFFKSCYNDAIKLYKLKRSRR